MGLSQCQLCGADIRWVMIDGAITALDTIASVDGPYRLDPEDIQKGERITTKGHSGFKLHQETCPKQTEGAVGR